MMVFVNEHKLQFANMFRLCLFLGLVFAVSAKSFEDKIVGGEIASIDQFPYQISLQYYGDHICGGSIVTKRQIITAAHCTNGMEVEHLSIRAGSSVHASGGQVIPLARYVNHANFNEKTYDYDLSIITLAYDLEFNESVQPIRMTTVEPTSGTAVVSGWGVTNENSMDPSPVLRMASLEIVPRHECNYRLPGRVTDRMICAAYLAGGRDACQGDSGGPLVLNGELVGVVSFGFGCARPSIPGLYTNIAHIFKSTVSFA